MNNLWSQKYIYSLSYPDEDTELMKIQSTEPSEDNWE